MRGDNHLLAVTTSTDEVTGAKKPLWSVPIQICQAVEEVKVGWDIAAPSGAKRKQQYVDAKTGEVVEDAECPRGVRLSDDDFKQIDAEDVEAINTALKSDLMLVEGEIPFTDVPWDRSTALYFVQSPAKGGSPKSYKILKESLRGIAKGKDKRPAKAIVTKRTVRSKQQLGVIYCDEDRDCLMFAALRFADSVRQPDDQVLAPNSALVEEKQLIVARKVIDGLGDGAQALATEYDESVAQKRALLEQAIEGETLTVPTPVAETTATDDLTAMLEASLAEV